MAPNACQSHAGQDLRLRSHVRPVVFGDDPQGNEDSSDDADNGPAHEPLSLRSASCTGKVSDDVAELAAGRSVPRLGASPSRIRS